MAMICAPMGDRDFTNPSFVIAEILALDFEIRVLRLRTHRDGDEKGKKVTHDKHNYTCWKSSDGMTSLWDGRSLAFASLYLPERDILLQISSVRFLRTSKSDWGSSAYCLGRNLDCN